ncbi:hypothetical protein AX17_007443 [Amanita inopinata Kibby_2008]|nr:hypothetical protein AX17_007443 [Amanita inopinata Kibby_2008]
MNSNNESSKTSGKLHSMKGSVVETLGNATGSRSMQQSGRNEHAQGEAEYKASQMKGQAEGTSHRMKGKKDSIVGAMTGDKSQQAAGNAKRDMGEALQE